MATLTEPQHTSEFLIAEAPGTISRDTGTVTVAASTTLAPGTVLGQITSSGKYVPFDDTRSDGAEVAAAILFDTLENAALTAADKTGATLINFAAEVRSADLNWLEGVTQAAGLADLRALGIKAR